jgi:hypothetical protein
LDYWSYIQPGNFKGRFKYSVATNKSKYGGLGAIDPTREIHALKAHWIVRMLNNRGDSWAELMWMELQNTAKKNNVKEPTSSKSWPSLFNVNSLMEDII